MKNAYQISAGRRIDPSAAPNYATNVQAATERRLLNNPAPRLEEQQARAALQALESLSFGWDGDEAEPISKVTRINAWDALTTFFSNGLIPEISPNVSGTISFEWSANGSTAHFQMGKTRFSMYIAPDGAPSQYFQGQAGKIPESAIASLADAIAPTHSKARTEISYPGSYGHAAR